MSNSRPSITSPLRRTTTDCPAFTLLCTAPAATPPWNSTAATSFTGIWRSWPPTRSVNPTPPRSTSSPVCRSPLRITIVAFSCAVATPDRTRLARATPQNIKVFLTIDSSSFCHLERCNGNATLSGILGPGFPMDELTVQPDVAFAGHPEENLADSPPAQLQIEAAPLVETSLVETGP